MKVKAKIAITPEWHDAVHADGTHARRLGIVVFIAQKYHWISVSGKSGAAIDYDAAVRAVIAAWNSQKKR